jgi:chromosome segregation protein
MLQHLRTKENEKNLASQRLDHLKEREEGLQDFLQKAEGQQQGIEESIAFTGTQLEEEAKALEGMNEQLMQFRNEMDAKRIVMDEKRIALDALRSGYQQVQRNQFDAEKKVAIADTSIQNLARAIQQIEDDKVKRDQQRNHLADELHLRERELNIKRTDLDQLQKHQDYTKEQILQTQALLDTLRGRMADEARKLDSKKNEHDQLKSLIESMEGYPDSVKFLHNNDAWNHTAPILSDIIYVKEEYRTALENVLEPYLSYYVVNNLYEGLQAVHLLDEHKKGKANFFLLDKLNEISVETGHDLSLQGVIPALDVIEVDEKYLGLARHLLSNVIIAENEEVLQNSNGFVVIEKTGRYVKGKYSLTGGSVGLFEGKKIGRAKNLEKLQEEIIAQNAVVELLKDEIQERHNEVIAFNEDLREHALKNTEIEIQELTNKVFSLHNKLENLHALQGQSQQRLEDLKNEIHQTQGSVEATRNDLKWLSEELVLQAAKVNEGEEIFKNEEASYNESNRQYNEFNLQVTKQQSKIAALRQELDFKNNQLNELKQQIENNTSQLSDTRQQIEQCIEQLEQVEDELFSMMKLKEEEERRLNEADQAYYNFRNELNEKESLLRHKVKDKEQVEHLLAEIKDKLNDVKLQLAGMKERLHVEFRIQLEDILDEARINEMTVDELQEKTDRMKKRLENLGEVNPTAIEAFTEMKKRYEFILEQKNDLVSAKDSLLQTIQEVELTANQKFLETFHLVRENFLKVFKSLFTDDDQCDLILENPENLAETGIDVIAKPKGKRPSSLTQLSGGERTLTATALLFAIYLIKPAPFCILDEVDAPLDDANVGKFTNMIREFSDNSQFIIVTHNKMTMSAVDVIYGFSMQEPGGSRLVPVDFRRLN